MATRRSASKNAARMLLPDSYGPKLHPFECEDPNAKIKFVRLLVSEPCQGSCHGNIFEVVILEKRYALKIFRFYDVAPDSHQFYETGIPDSLVAAHLDPFHAECRAYGRIEKVKRYHNVAVRCFGYLEIPARYEAVIQKGFKNLKFKWDWNRPDEEYRLSVDKRQPFRAIVKDFVPTDIHFTMKMVSRMRRDLSRLRKLGIYTRDIRKENYVGGKLVDFSSSWTVPHIMLMGEFRDAADVNEDLDLELDLFNEMVEDEEAELGQLAAPRPEHREKPDLFDQTAEPNVTAALSLKYRERLRSNKAWKSVLPLA